MIKTIKRLIRKYPTETALTLYNLSIFAWLRTHVDALVAYLTNLIQTTASNQLTARGFSDVMLHNIMDTSQSMVEITSNLLTQAKTATWSWLLVSMLLTFALRMVKSTLRIILIGIILGAGLYLTYSFFVAK